MPHTDCSSTEKEAGELCGTPVHLPTPRSTVLPCPETLGVNGLGGLKGYPEQSRQLFRCGAFFFFPLLIIKMTLAHRKKEKEKGRERRKQEKRKHKEESGVNLSRLSAPRARPWLVTPIHVGSHLYHMLTAPRPTHCVVISFFPLVSAGCKLVPFSSI